MFTGFNLKYPEYEIITPQTHLSFTVRSLNVQEEENLKGSLITPSKVTDHLNKCIYETIVKKPDMVIDYRTFLKYVTLKDRDAILYGLYHITYEEIRNYDIRCSQCKKEYQVTAIASSMFNFNSYPEEDIINKRIKVELPVYKGISVIIKQPTLEDEEYAFKTISTHPSVTNDLVIETLIIDKFEQDLEASKEPISITERIDIIDAFRSLPARDKRTIYTKYSEEFGKYGIDLKMKSSCTHCGNEEVITIDLVDNFFRMVYSA
jgi:hypothetical protein